LSEQGEIHQHSGWLIPLVFVILFLGLSGLMLLYYLRPLPVSLRDNRPTAAATRLDLTVRGVRLSIPANYLEGRRNGGDVDVVPIFALLPDMRGYSDADAALFRSNAADSPVIHMLLRADTNSLGTEDRFTRIYKPYFRDPHGAPGPFGLTLYQFRPATGYGRDDLYVGEDGGMLLLLCEQPAQDLPSPNCLAIDRQLTPELSYSYRFKRAWLGRWQEIATGVDDLIAKFRIR